MENAKTLNALDEFAKAKPKDIPKELDDYLRHVAASGDPIYQWSLVKFLFRQKLLNVIMDFYESCPMMDLPFNANLDPFNFETVKKRLLERYDFFTGVPFTIQRLAELLTSPKKQYNRLDKFLRALEKNIWVVSTREPVNHEDSDDSDLVNGLSPSLLQSSDIENNPEESSRNSHLPDGSEETALPLSKEIITPVAEEEDDAVNSIEPVLQTVSETDLVPETDNLINTEEPPIDNVISGTSDSIEESNSKTEEDEPTSPEKSDEPNETSSEQETFVAETSTETKEEKKAEEIVVEEGDVCPTGAVLSDTIEPIPTIEPQIFEEVPKIEGRPDLKRKIDDVLDEDDKAVAPKKLETEQAYIESEIENKPISPIEDIAAEIIEPVDNDKVDDNNEVIEAVEITEIEGNMDSSEVDDKIEMVVEETEQAMDIDESSILSPMVQEDAVELMEATEMGSS